MREFLRVKPGGHFVEALLGHCFLRNRNHDINRDAAVRARFGVHRGAQNLQSMLEVGFLESFFDHGALCLD